MEARRWAARWQCDGCGRFLSRQEIEAKIECAVDEELGEIMAEWPLPENVDMIEAEAEDGRMMRESIRAQVMERDGFLWDEFFCYRCLNGND